MARTPCCDKTKVKRGSWSPKEDDILKNYLHKHGTHGNWIALPPKAADHDLSGTMFAYDPIYYSLPRINEVDGFSCNFSPSQEGSSVSESSSVLAIEDNYTTWSANGGLEHHPHHQQLDGISFDMISHGYPCEFMSGPWSSQQAVVEALPSAFSSSYYVDTKPQGLCPDIPTNL